MPLLSQSIDSVPADFIKHIITVILAGAGAWAAYLRGKRVAGTKDEPLNLAQPVGVKVETEVQVRPAPEWASKDETAKELENLEGRMEGMARENLRQHNVTASSLSKVMQAGLERESRIVEAIHQMERGVSEKSRAELKAIHDRLNPVAEGMKAHEATLKQIESRISSMESARVSETARLHQRIDDAIRAASQRGGKA